jgi:hypothetical protein
MANPSTMRLYTSMTTVKDGRWIGWRCSSSTTMTSMIADVGVQAEWPCWGKMRTIHCDNAKEFRGTVIGRACQDHDIAIDHRPPREPRYGGHIERGFGTWLTKKARRARELRHRPPRQPSATPVKPDPTQPASGAVTIPGTDRYADRVEAFEGIVEPE